jgi:hypothetical protein
MKSAHFQINKKKDNKNNNQHTDMKLILMEKKKKIKEIKMQRDKTLKTLKFNFNLNMKKQSSKNLKTYNSPKKKLQRLRLFQIRKIIEVWKEIKKYIKVQKLQVLLMLK